MARYSRLVRRIVVASVVSALGDGCGLVALPLVASKVEPGHVALAVGSVLGAFTLPGAATGLLAPAALRRRTGRELVIADSLLRATCVTCIAAAYAFDMLQLWTLVALAALSSLLHPWGIGGRYDVIASTLPAGDRFRANHQLAIGTEATLIFGPALGGMLAATSGVATVLVVDALSFLAPAVALAHARSMISTQRAVGATGGLRMLTRDHHLRRLLAATFVFYLLYGPVEVALAARVTRNHGGAQALALYWSLFGVGAIASRALAAPIEKHMRDAPTLIIIGWGLAIGAVGVTHGIVAAAAFGVGGLLFTPYPALTAAAVQNRAGSVTTAAAAWSSTLLLATPMGAIVGGPIVAAAGPSSTLVCSGVLTCIVGAALLARESRQPLVIDAV
jgi:predicted MFS family arabinose efflux permease